MELGSLPLYYEINRLCRLRPCPPKDLKHLGPYIKALGAVTAFAESHRAVDDKIMTGKHISGKNNN